MKSVVAAVFLFEKLHRGPLYVKNFYLYYYIFLGEKCLIFYFIWIGQSPNHANLLDLLCNLRA